MAKKYIGGKNSKSKVSFAQYDYEDTGEVIDGVKVITPKSGHGSLPDISDTPNTIYILQVQGHYKSIGIYGYDRRLVKSIDIGHGHTNRYKNRKGNKIPRGTAHVHNHKGGRSNNVRKMTKKEIAKYGAIVKKIGGKTE